MSEKKQSEPRGEGGNPADEAGAAEVQAKVDEANEKGYYGEVPDDTPNENYTLKGVTSGAPTPETERGK